MSNGWRLIPKSPATQPTIGSWPDWKEQIAEECFRQCVYCTIGIRPWGGLDHYHIDHYRPISLFDVYKDDICNLFLACPICNRFKSNDWPNDPIDLETVSYPDPSKVDYSDLFDEVDFLLVGKFVASRYLITRLFLNRPQLVYERRERYLMKREREVRQEVRKLLTIKGGVEDKDKAFEIMDSILEHFHKREHIPPYKLAEIRRP